MKISLSLLIPYLLSDEKMSFLGATLGNLHIPSIGGIKKQIESFLEKYPGELEFPKNKDFQYAYAKLFKLVECVSKNSKDLTFEDKKFKKR